MKRSQVEHVLRAAAAITQETSFFVLGSHAPFRHRMIDLDTMIERAGKIDASKHNVQRVVSWIRRRAQEAQAAQKATP